MKKIILVILIVLSSISLIAKDKYLIITNERYNQSDELKSFIEYRNNDFDVVVALNLEIGTKVEQFMNFIIQQSPDYVLLVGNYKDFPSKSIPYSKPVESYNYWVAKQVDSLFQINIPLGLFFIENESELENIILKTIKFEQILDEMPNKLFTHAGGSFVEPLPPWPIEFNDEILNEMYESFFKHNGYLHQHETSLDDTPNDAPRDAQAINNGVKYMLYHGHGNIQKWSFGMGVEGIKVLKNDKFSPIIFSASCLTGTFTGKIDTVEAPCFATNMLASHYGAAAFIGAYNESSRGMNPLLYGFSKSVNDKKSIRLGDALLSAFNNIEMPETVKKYHPHVAAFEYNRARLQFHLFGDPALKINISPTSIESNSENYIIISPNPASEYIEINLDRWTPPSSWTPSGAEIKIYNTFGESLINYEFQITNYGENIRIDISHLPAGVYFIRIGEQDSMFVKL